jgi:hypothetical protein
MDRKVVSLLFLTSAISGTKLEEKTKRELQDDSGISPSQFPDWGLGDENGDGFPDFPGFGDVDFPDFGWGDWGDMDWDNFDFENFDWANMNWGDGAWDDFLGNLDGEIFDVCPILESAIGMGQSFGLAGDCSCEGDMGTGLSIQCAFEDECVEDSEICGAVSLNFTFGDENGTVSTSTCVDVENSVKQICYTYGIDMTDTLEQTCTATYGGDGCTCKFQGFCLHVDCGAYLPGAVTSTCQEPEIQQDEDVTTWIPRFKIFEPDYTGLAFEDIDVNNIDWMNFDWENFDFSTVEWGNRGWEDLFADQNFDNLSICPILESAISLGESFGIAAECTCYGAMTSGMSIACKFDECIDDTEICGSVDVNFSFDDLGSVSAGTCFDLDNDEYRQICFVYEIPMADFSATTCSASYGGEACDCEIQDFCLSVDCSKYLPGLKMDTCQNIEIKDEEDTTTFVPRFAIFDEAFEGYSFEDIDWQKLDWQNLDWENFSLDQVNWENTDLAATTWKDIFSDDMSDGLVCPVLRRVIDMSEEFGIAGDCSCDEGTEGGFNINCSFQDQCTDENICGSVDLKFGFDNVGSAKGNVCVDFSEDEHPETCFSYKVPIADRLSPPECAATFGGASCKCEIDENFCMAVDCSEHDPSAVIETCQVINLEKSNDAAMLVPRFAKEKAQNMDPNSPSEANGNENSSADYLSRLSLATLALVSLPALFM